MYDNGGVLLDNKNVKTFENPERHNMFCLIDVPRCVNSGFQVMGPKNPDTGVHCPGFRLDGVETATAVGREREAAGETVGFLATVKGTVKELGDGSFSAAGPPLLTDYQVLDDSVGCEGNRNGAD